MTIQRGLDGCGTISLKNRTKPIQYCIKKARSTSAPGFSIFSTNLLVLNYSVLFDPIFP